MTRARAMPAAPWVELDGLVPLGPPLEIDPDRFLRRLCPPPASKGSLFAAIEENDTEAFLKAGPEAVKLVDERKRPLLFLAVLEGRTEIVQSLVALGSDLNPRKFHPLYAAAMRNRPKEARLLIEAGSKPGRARSRDGDPVLVEAAFRANLAVLRELLRVPHPVRVKSLALLEAAGRGHLPCVKLLVRHGADPDWVSSRGNSARSIASKQRRAEVVRFFGSLKE